MLTSFGKWLSRRRKKERITSDASSAPEPGPGRLDPDEIQAMWRDSLTVDPGSGMTDAVRKAATVQPPKHHMSPDEIQVLWKSLQPTGPTDFDVARVGFSEREFNGTINHENKEINIKRRGESEPVWQSILSDLFKSYPDYNIWLWEGGKARRLDTGYYPFMR